MKVVVQRVKKASVKVEEKTVGKINTGFMLLVGFTEGDNIDTVNKMASKILKLRIMDDEEGKINNSLDFNKDAILSISQFTLYGDTNKGNRPSFVNAMKGDKASKLYDEFNNILSKSIKVEKGIFGADMEVSLINDGPITLVIEM